MEVAEVTAGRGSVVFSGSAAQVESAFTPRFIPTRLAMKFITPTRGDPEIPAAFAGVVGGVVSLHDFRSAP